MAQRNGSKVGAFTLVELLVVIGIIAVLVSMLLPVLNKAREHAKTVQCLSNLKQIVIACNNYSTTWKGVVIPSEYKNPPLDANDTRDMWTTILASDGFLPTSLLLDGPEPNPSNSPLYCPSSRTIDSPSRPLDHAKPWKSPVLRPDKWIASSYGMNGHRRLDRKFPAAILPSFISGGSGPTTYEMKKMSRARQPARLAFVLDGYGGVALDSWSPTRLTIENVDPRHERRTKTNVAFFDGHAETFLRKDLPDENNIWAFPDQLTAKYPAVLWRVDQ
jgi:prepilin-type processing-associated H-X9-DG protein